MTGPMKLPPTLTVDQAVAYTGIGRVATYAAIKDGTFPFPHFNIGRRIAIPTKPLMEALGLEVEIEWPNAA